MKTQPKIALVGAGNIGGTLALLAGFKELGNVALVDVIDGIPQGKSLDIAQAMALHGVENAFKGTSSFEEGIQDADIVIVTAGSPRKPGMSRDDLLSINAKVIKDVGTAIRKSAPQAFVIVVTNPLDAMVWVMQTATQFPPHRVVGMAGILDSSRFKYFIAQELNVSVKDVSTLVLGGHGDTMVPLLRYTSVSGIPLQEFIKMNWISEKRVSEIVERTRSGGGEIVNLLKTGSAFYAPALSALEIAESYLKNQKRLLPCAAWCQGEYGIHNLYVGVPVIIGSEGVERIIDLPLTLDEREQLTHSANSVRTLIEDVQKLTKEIL